MGDATGRFVLEVVPWFYCQDMLDSGPGFSKLARLGGGMQRRLLQGHTLNGQAHYGCRPSGPGAGSQDLPGGLHVLHSPHWLQEVW